jgi:nucleotide-binding universal stress UspA family protein
VFVELPAEDGMPTQARLERLKPASDQVRVTHRLLRGDPAGEILKLADAETADLIVLGTHGRGGLGRLLMGSVAEAVLRKAPCPVLTVKTLSPTGKPRPASPDLAVA